MSDVQERVRTEDPLQEKEGLENDENIKSEHIVIPNCNEEVVIEDQIPIINNDKKNETENEIMLRDLTIEQRNQLDEYLKKINELEANASKFIVKQSDLEQKLDLVSKQKELAVKEKESMVMRYAVSEKSVLQQKTAKDQAEKKCKEAQRENDLLQHKLTSMSSDKTRICQILDNKSYDLKTSQQELDRTKSDITALETKLKWSQNSLKNEIELRKDSDSKVETLTAKIQEQIHDIEKVRKDAHDAIKEFYTSQENRAYVLDKQVNEQQASLILLRHEREDREHHVKNLQTELERIQKKQNETLHENNALSMKVQQLEKDRYELEQRLTELRGCADQQRQDSADLNAKIVLLDQMKLQLITEQEQLVASNEHINILKQRNSDLENDMESCRIREAEVLLFTQQLTDKNVRLQSEFTSMETKVQQLTCEQTILKRAAKEHETKAILLSSQLVEERRKYSEENEKLTTDLNGKVRMCDRIAQEVADQKGENSVIKRKFELSLREVNKELMQCRKKLDQYESNGTSSSSSSTSLNTVERGSSSPTLSSDLPDQVKVMPERVLDKQTLIEHIVKLQRVSARKSEKLDFLEEHVNTLVAELQKKSRLLQSYILREQAGTLTSNTMDKNKAAIAKYSGIMASIYGSKVIDENLTMELCLDINRKLQAILEDALLKNITLKENVDTLGAEIDRLLKKDVT